MFLFIKKPDIIEIYKKIANALLEHGREICNDLNSVFQLDLSPPRERSFDKSYIRFYTVDLKKGKVMLSFLNERQPRADMVFKISENDFVNLYKGRRRTAVEYLFTGKLKLLGNYNLAVDFYYKFLLKYVKNPDDPNI
jgi:hypothetical protein